MPGMVSLRQRVAELIPELAKFGVVGLLGSIVDLGGAAYLHGVIGIGPLISKALSVAAAIVITYLGSRFWTFRHRVNQALLREGTLFVALNLVGLVIAECVIAFITYGLGLKGALAYNAASVAGTGFGTVFRYFSYKKWVFLAGAPGDAAVPGIVDAAPTGEAVPTGAVYGYGPPWDYRYRPATEHGYAPAAEHGYAPFAEHGYAPAAEHGYAPAAEHGYAPAAERGYGPPWDDRYGPLAGRRSGRPREYSYGPPWEHLDQADADPTRR
jgi:putative flippase GtrA